MNAVVLAAGTGAVIVSQVLAFLLLAFCIWKFGIPVMRKALNARSKEVADAFEKLEKEAREATDRIADFRTRLEGIEAEAKRRHQAAIEEGAAARAQAVAEGNAQAAAELEKAKRSIGIERDKAVLELRAEVARLTLDVTERTVDAVMDEKVHGRIVDGYLDGLGKAAAPK